MRPKHKIKLDIYDKTVEILSFATAAWLIWLVFRYYPELPGRVPSHFNITGEVDAYSTKSSFLVLPVIGLAIFFSLQILNHFPHIFNYPKQITTENALRQYTLATKLIRMINLILILAFAFITYRTILIALQESSGLPISFTFLFLGSTGGILVMYIWKMKNP